MRFSHCTLLATSLLATPLLATPALAGEPTLGDLQAAYEAARVDAAATHVVGLEILGAECEPASEGRYSCQVGFSVKGETDGRVYLDAISVRAEAGPKWVLLAGLCRK